MLESKASVNTRWVQIIKTLLAKVVCKKIQARKLY